MWKKTNITHCYDDIIGLAHHVSATRSHMPAIDRAAQFAPFAALTGHDAAIRETARLTDAKIELDESKKAMLDERIRLLLEWSGERPEVTILFFRPDGKKDGGAYRRVTGQVKRLDAYRQNLILEDKTVIPLEQVCEIEGDLFDRRYLTD